MIEEGVEDEGDEDEADGFEEFAEADEDEGPAAWGFVEMSGGRVGHRVLGARRDTRCWGVGSAGGMREV